VTRGRSEGAVHGSETRRWPRRFVLVFSVVWVGVVIGTSAIAAREPRAESDVVSVALRTAAVDTEPANPPTTSPSLPALAAGVAPVAEPVAAPPPRRPAAVGKILPTDPCAAALAYLAAHAAPGFAHHCRPGSLHTPDGPVAAYTCVPGSTVSCPDGVAEIIIAAPTCAASYRNEASNSHWDFSEGGIVAPGTVQNGRTWDPYGPCPAPQAMISRAGGKGLAQVAVT
jgi:hypothetical protein